MGLAAIIIFSSSINLDLRCKRADSVHPSAHVMLSSLVSVQGPIPYRIGNPCNVSMYVLLSVCDCENMYGLCAFFLLTYIDSVGLEISFCYLFFFFPYHCPYMM